MFDFSKDYLYHSSYKLEEILKSGFILSTNNIGGYDQVPCWFNANDFISLSKKVTNNLDINQLTLDNIYIFLNLIDELEEHKEAFYRYAFSYPTFIFNTNIGEIATNFVDNEKANKYNNDDTKRYSNLIGKFQIRDAIDIKKAVTISLPHDINIFKYNPINQIRKLSHCSDYSALIEIQKILTLEQIELIEKYLPNTTIVDISSQKVLTKSLFNDII